MTVLGHGKKSSRINLGVPLYATSCQYVLMKYDKNRRSLVHSGLGRLCQCVADIAALLSREHSAVSVIKHRDGSCMLVMAEQIVMISKTNFILLLFSLRP